MSLRVHLTEPGAPIEPGSEGVAAVTVVNTSSVVAAYVLDVVGVTGWGLIEPRELRLFPEQAGDALVHFRPPKSPDVTSGPHTFAVKVAASDNADLSVVEEGTVTVGVFTAGDLAVRPKTVRSSRKGKFRILLTNTGNTRQHYELSASDVDEIIELKPSSEAMVLDLVSPASRRSWLARLHVAGERLPFTATAEVPA
jgi:hypothetical protein